MTLESSGLGRKSTTGASDNLPESVGSNPTTGVHKKKEGICMMETGDFKELMDLKKKYKNLKTARLEKQRALRDCQNRVQEKVNKLQTNLDFKRNDMLGNKEQREEYGITNQQVWSKKIKELTLTDEEEIQQIRRQSQEQIEGFERDIENLTLDISDVGWELRIKLEAYKDSQYSTMYVEQVGSEEILGQRVGDNG